MINRRCIATLLAIIMLVAAGKNSHAGIGPENVIVVVNADSLVSRTIANHYIQARDIPSGNVIMLTDVPAGLQVSLADFKTKILTPILDTLNARGLAAQSRVIAYSADFPTAVNVAEHRKRIVNPQVKKLQAGVASINGATFFYRFMLADQHEYLNFGSNLYARGKFDRNFANPFNGDNQEKFDSAAKDFAEERFDAAAKSFSELFAESPSLSPLALRAAEAYAKSGDEQQAIALLKAAILAGWWSGRYLEENEALQKLLGDPVLSETLPLMSTAPIAVQGPAGFANHRGYTASGHAVPIDKGGIAYLLSCSLAVVHERGSTVDQAIAVLERAAQADNTFPRGDFRFAGNADVRAQTRFPNVADALVYLQDSGHKTEVFRSKLPSTAGDVAGLMVGYATVDLANQKWRLVPGAIAENLTSFGGAYNISGHTKITDFLHAGAAMSSGTVAEPYALQFKFPLPMMYGYYADGVSAIEAFYLSVASPYQLLIVGDPLCQPFARAPAAWIDISLSDEQANRVVVSMQPIDLKQPQTQTRVIELYVGGRLIQQTPPTNTINFKLPAGASGAIDLRAALIGFDVTEPRISFSADLDLKGPLATPQVTVTQNRQADSAEMKFSLQCNEADSIDLLYLNEAVGVVQGAAGELAIDTTPLGSGPLRFRARAHFGDKIVLGMPLVAQPK